MKVSELIELLKERDPDAEVCIGAYYHKRGTEVCLAEHYHKRGIENIAYNKHTVWINAGEDYD